MKQWTAFTKKEFLELIRTGKLFLLGAVFILFGIMNPAIAKLTPWMFRMLSDSMKESGIIINEVEINALTSWTQFYKNVPIALLLFLILQSNILTAEYQKGTLTLLLTKGMPRPKIILSKACAVLLSWSACYWLCYGITYAYNDFFWDNSIVSNMFLGAFCIYLLGIWLISLLFLMSSLFSEGITVLIAAGFIYLAVYLLHTLPAVQKYLPAALWTSGKLLSNLTVAQDYRYAIGIAFFFSLFNLIASVLLFNKRTV